MWIMVWTFQSFMHVDCAIWGWNGNCVEMSRKKFHHFLSRSMVQENTWNPRRREKKRPYCESVITICWFAAYVPSKNIVCWDHMADKHMPANLLWAWTADLRDCWVKYSPCVAVLVVIKSIVSNNGLLVTHSSCFFVVSCHSLLMLCYWQWQTARLLTNSSFAC